MTLLDKLPGWRPGDVRAVRPSATGQHMTTEKVEAVFENGDIQVRGFVVRRAGEGFAKVGSRVLVQWNGRAPIVAYAHEVQKAKFGKPSAPTALGVLEELFIFGQAIWFRNENQFRQVGTTTLASASVFWGLGSADYFVVTAEVSGAQVYEVWKLNRKKANEPFASADIPAATLIATYNLGSIASPSGVVLGTFSASLSGPSISTLNLSGNLLYRSLFSVSGPSVVHLQFQTGNSFAGIGPTGDLFVAVFIRSAANVANNTDAEGTHGGLLVNVTRSEVVARHASSFTYSTYPTGGGGGVPDGTVTVTLSDSVPVLDAGFIEGLSYKLSPTKINVPNNYLVSGPAFSTSPDAPDETTITISKTLRVFGQYAQTVATVPTSAEGANFRQVSVQASRTRVIWGVSNNLGTFVEPLRMKSLAKPAAAEIGTSANAQTLFAAPIRLKSVYAVQSDLVVSFSLATVAPYNQQFFVAGIDRQTGAIVIDVAALRKLAKLQDVDDFFPVRKQAQINIVENATSHTVQAIVSRTSLGPFYLAGPL